MAAAESKNDMNTFLLKLLECPVCYGHLIRPILMCRNGHNVCNNCISKMATCPVCKGGKPLYRNLFAEQTSANIVIKCGNRKYGCKEMLNVETYTDHLTHCLFKFDCRVRYLDENKKCEWVGSTKQALKKHVLTSHAGHHLDGFIAEINCKIVPSRNMLFARLASAYDKLFWISLEYYPDGKHVYSYVTYVGSDKKAPSFKYSFDFTSMEVQRTITFKGQCHFLHSKHESVRVAVPFQSEFINALAMNGEIECQLLILNNE